MLSADENYDPDVVAITGASAALALSEIPFQKTLAGVRVGYVDGEIVINPTYEQRKRTKLDIVVAGSMDGLVMVEAGAKEVGEDDHRPGPRGRARRDQVDRGHDRRDGREGRQAQEGRRRPR